MKVDESMPEPAEGVDESTPEFAIVLDQTRATIETKHPMVFFVFLVGLSPLPFRQTYIEPSKICRNMVEIWLVARNYCIYKLLFVPV